MNNKDQKYLYRKKKAGLSKGLDRNKIKFQRLRLSYFLFKTIKKK